MTSHVFFLNPSVAWLLYENRSRLVSSVSICASLSSPPFSPRCSAAVSQAKLAGGAVKIEDVDHRRHRCGISATNRIYFPRNLCLQPSIIVLLLLSRCLETRRDSPIIAAESRRVRLTFGGEKKPNKKQSKKNATGYNRQRRSRIPPPGSASTISGVNAIGQTNRCLTSLHFLLRFHPPRPPPPSASRQLMQPDTNVTLR